MLASGNFIETNMAICTALRQGAQPINISIYISLHIAAILPAHAIERARQLAERAQLAGLHERGEDVAAVERGALHRRPRCRRAVGVACPEGVARADGIILFLAGG